MNLNHVIESCQRMLTDRNDFWLLSALTDRSYEEGVRNSTFKESASSYAAIGLQQELSKQLQLGINGNLAQICEEKTNAYQSVVRNVSRVPDICLRTDATETFIEVKLIYDCTFLKYYSSVAVDTTKLRACSGQSRQLVQIVFFSELSNFYYPSGKWYRAKWAKDRPGWLVRKGITSQYTELRHHICQPPTWPDDGPYRQALRFPGDFVGNDFLERWFQSVFVPDHRWEFHAEEQLYGATIGVAIWDWTSEE